VKVVPWLDLSREKATVESTVWSIFHWFAGSVRSCSKAYSVALELVWNATLAKEPMDLFDALLHEAIVHALRLFNTGSWTMANLINATAVLALVSGGFGLLSVTVSSNLS